MVYVSLVGKETNARNCGQGTKWKGNVTADTINMAIPRVSDFDLSPYTRSAGRCRIIVKSVNPSYVVPIEYAGLEQRKIVGLDGHSKTFTRNTIGKSMYFQAYSQRILLCCSVMRWTY